MLATLTASPIGHLVLAPAQVWVIIVGAATPLLSYVANTTLWKNAPEPVKALVQAVLAAITAGVTTAITTNVLGWNSASLQLIVTGVIAAFGAHAILWKPSEVAARLTKG